MKAKLEEMYARHIELKGRYNIAASKEEKETIADEYNDFENEIALNGQMIANIYRMYRNSMDVGNDYLVIDEMVYDQNLPELVNLLRQLGVEMFTFSSTWSCAIETAWLFTQNGCTLDRLVEINSQRKEYRTGKYEKAYGYLFKVN